MGTFDLEQSIRQWRRKLQKQRDLEPGHVEELETYLRDKVDDLTSAGMSAEAAFSRVIAEQFDDLEELAGEYHIARSHGRPPRREWEANSRFFTLFPNFLKVALRSMRRKKGYAAINLFGLAVGLSACMLMILHINFELSFDRFHDKQDRIYRLATTDFNTNGWPIGLLLRQNYPEVEKVTYLRRESYPISHDNSYFFETTFIADQQFLEIFDFPLAEGDRATALTEPNTVVITEALQQKYFGSESALGKTLTMRDSLQFTVSGVLEEIPENSHIQFDALVSFPTWTSDKDYFNTNSRWLDVNMYNYVLLREGTDVAAFRDKVRDIYMEGAGEAFKRIGMHPVLHLEALTDIYLRSPRGNGLGPSSDIGYLNLLGGVAAFLLVIACINFMNLSTARSLERAKEVGVRKAVGSTRKSLVVQFLSESTLTATAAMILATGLAMAALPWFNELNGSSFGYSDLITAEMGFVLLGFIAVVGLLSGLYPAFILSDFQPVQVLKNRFPSTGRGSGLRKGLVVFQFAISCFLIICTIVVFKQLDFMLDRDAGYDRDQVVVMDVRQAARTGASYEAVKQELERAPQMREVSSMLAPPARSGWRSILAYSDELTEEQPFHVEYLPVDHNYISLFGLNVIAGRGFSEDYPSDRTGGVVINEAAVEAFGWTSPEAAIGEHVITLNNLLDDPVIGVIENYHHHGLQEQIQPLVMVIEPQFFQYHALKIDAAGTEAVLDHMQETWDAFYPGYTFSYFFLDEDFQRQYLAEQRLSRIYGTFSILAILIACLGLVGLTAYSMSRRTKEMGVRKILGASVPDIVLLVSREFLVLVGAAFLIASPLAWWFMQDWLEEFAFRTGIGAGVFILTLAISLLIALLSISFHAVRAATANPVKSLRSE